MSFYSAIILAANRNMRIPRKEELSAIYDAAGIVKPKFASDALFNLNGDISTLFADSAARAENTHFFYPDTISTSESILIQDSDGIYEGKGFAISISGSGYFFPWGNDDLRDRILASPKLKKLAMLVQEACGGHFEVTEDDADFWSRVTVESKGGWSWFRSESL